MSEAKSSTLRAESIARNFWRVTRVQRSFSRATRVQRSQQDAQEELRRRRLGQRAVSHSGTRAAPRFFVGLARRSIEL